MSLVMRHVLESLQQWRMHTCHWPMIVYRSMMVVLSRNAYPQYPALSGVVSQPSKHDGTQTHATKACYVPCPLQYSGTHLLEKSNIGRPRGSDAQKRVINVLVRYCICPVFNSIDASKQVMMCFIRDMRYCMQLLTLMHDAVSGTK